MYLGVMSLLPDLPPQHGAPLVVDETALGETGLADQLLEAGPIELTTGTTE